MRIIPAFFACITALTLILPPNVFGAGVKERTVKIGVIAPLTGPFASGGNSFMKSLSVAAKEMNEKGGVAGRKISLIRGDTEGRVSRARNEALRLIEREKVQFLIGAYLSEETMGVVEVASEYGIILMIPVSATDEITELVKTDPSRYRYIFRVGYSVTQWASMIGDFITSRDYSRYAFIGSQIRWNRELRGSLKKYLGERGVTEILADFYSPKQPVIKPLALRVKSASPDIIVVGDPGKNAIEVIKSLDMTAYGKPVLSVGGTLADKRVALDLSPNLPLYAIASCFPGSSENAAPYYDRFEKTYGYPPSGYSDTLPGDALVVLLKAIAGAGNLDTGSVIDELERGEFAATAGTYTFDSSHQANWGSGHTLSGAVIRWNESSFELVRPER